MTVSSNQGLSIQRVWKHCINFAENKNYLVGTVPYRHCKEEIMNYFKSVFFFFFLGGGGIEIRINYL